MKKVYKIEVDCALCAEKIQNAISKVNGVNSVNISFMSQKMVLDLDEYRQEEVLKEIKKVSKKVEPDFKIYE